MDKFVEHHKVVIFIYSILDQDGSMLEKIGQAGDIEVPNLH